MAHPAAAPPVVAARMSGSAPHTSGPVWRPSSNVGVHAGARPHLFANGARVSAFNESQHTAWSNGHYWHGRHHGHNGWWWFAGGGWFFYPNAIYPYPDYVSDFADYPSDYYGPPGNQTWWYCRNPAGYYPYVRNCMIPWQPVQAAPPPPPPAGDQQAYTDGPTPGADQGPPNGPEDQSGPPPDGGPNGPGGDGPPPPNGYGPDNGPPPGNPPSGH